MAYYPLLRRGVQLTVVVLTVAATLARGAYYIHDIGGGVLYGSSPSWGNWTVLTTGAFDFHAKLYGGTVTEIDCFDFHNCTMTIPFNGSGIALYAMLLYDMTFAVSIDSGTPTDHQFAGVKNCCNGTVPPVFDFQIYNVSSLSLDNHKLFLTLENTTTPGASQIYKSYLYFDYAIVNSTNVNPTPSMNSSPKPASRSMIGPAVGGAIGGIVAISAIIVVLFCVRRRTRRGDTVAISSDPPTSTSYVDDMHTVRESQLPSYHGTLPELSPSTPVTEQRLQSHPIPTASPDPPMPHLSPTIPVTSSIPSQQTNTVPSPLIDVIPNPQDSSTAADSALAAEEVRYLRDLYSRNLPPDEINGLIQAMRQRRQVASIAPRASGEVGNAELGSPPSYDFTK